MSKKGFVIINEDGKYAVNTVQRTHAGENMTLRWVENVNEAYVFSGPELCIIKKGFFQGSHPGIQVLEAEEVRMVKLIKWSEDDA